MPIGKILESICLSVVLFLASYLSGLLPLKMPLNSHRVNLASFLSMGVITGTALMMALPESIEVLYDQNVDFAKKYVGPCLLGGFMFMFIIDHLSIIFHSLGLGTFTAYKPLSEKLLLLELVKSVITTPLTLGLAFHALVDGLSLGSSFHSNSDGNKINIVFFLVIIVHKLPTCFSLTSLLLKDDMDYSLIKFHLLIFALVTPISSIISSVFLSFLKKNNETIIGVLLVFSSGNFFYVVSHIFKENLSKHQLPDSRDSSETVIEVQSDIGLSEYMATILGVFITVVIAILGSDH